MTHDELVAIESRCYAEQTGQALQDSKALITEVRKLMRVIRQGSEISRQSPDTSMLLWQYTGLCYTITKEYKGTENK